MRAFYMCAAALLIFGGCEFSCNVGGFSAKKIQKGIEKTLSEQGIKATATCPKIEKNSTATCTAKTSDGKIITVAVVTNDKKATYKTTNLSIGSKVEKLIDEHYRTKLQITFDAIKCPKLIFGGEEATCVAKSGPLEVRFKVSGTGEQTRFDPLSGLIAGDKAAELIRTNFSGKTVKVDCGAKLRLSMPGARFTCTAKSSNGETKTVHVKIKDDKGNISMGLTPPE